MNGFRFMLVAAALFAGSGATPAPSFPFDQTPYSNAQVLVDIGGRRMNLYCVGSGSPTIVLDSGFGSAMWTWGYIQNRLGELSRTCAYDRAGYGFSDPGPLPRDAASIAADLHSLLGAANVAPPYILVGHSLGGYHVRYFADKYPQQVFGLVLIDPATTATWPILNRITTVSAADKADTKRRQMCEATAINKQFDSPSWAACVETDPRYSEQMTASRQATKRRPGYWATVNSEYVSGPEDERELSAVPVGYAKKPVIILTAAETWTAATLGASQIQVSELNMARLEAHQKAAAQSALGIDCVVRNTSHFIQIEQPSAVISAVESIVNTQGLTKPTCPR